MNAADIAPVRPDAQTQSSADLFLIFVGANVVATTFQVGASLAASFSLRASMLLIGVGSVAGAALVAALAPIGSRLRVPSVIAARPALGIQGAGVVAALLYGSNFAWIALNNVIAARVCAGALGGGRHEAAWSIGVGLLATAVAPVRRRGWVRPDRKHCGPSASASWPRSSSGADLRRWRAPIGSRCRFSRSWQSR